MSRRRKALAVGASLAVISGVLSPVFAGTGTTATTTTAPTVSAFPAPGGVRVQWPLNTSAVTISRTNPDGTTTALTPKPYKGHSFLDTTASPSTSYGYQVTAVTPPAPKVSTATDAPRRVPSPYANGQVLGSVTVTSRRAPLVSKAGFAAAMGALSSQLSATSIPTLLADAAAAPATPPPAVSVVNACTIPDITAGALTQSVEIGPTVTGGCPTYTLSTDLTVPAGTTLTVDPGTTINAGDHTITVLGGLVATGTSASPVVFHFDGGGLVYTADPSPGDTSTTVPTGSLSYVDVTGAGITSVGYALPVSNVTVTDAGLWGLGYLDPNGPVSVAALTVHDALLGVVEVTLGQTVQPFTVTGSNLFVGDSWPGIVGIGDLYLGAPASVPVSFDSDQVWADGAGIGVLGIGGGSTAGATALTGTISNSQVYANPFEYGYRAKPNVPLFDLPGQLFDGTGVLLAAVDTGAAAASGCTACNAITLSGDKVLSEGVGAFAGALASAQGAASSVTDLVNGGSQIGGVDTGLLSAAYSGGEGVTGDSAVASPTVDGSTLAGGVDAALTNAASGSAATAEPTVTNQAALYGGGTGFTQMCAYNAAGLSCPGDPSGPNEVGLDNEATSGAGAATATPTVTNATITGTGDALYNDAEAASATALADGSYVVDHSTLTSDGTEDNSGAAVESYADNTMAGGASSTPTVSNGSVLSSVGGDAVYTAVNWMDYYPGDGPATLGGTFSGSQLYGQASGNGAAYEGYAASQVHDALIDPAFHNVTAKGSWAGVYAESGAIDGSARTAPVVDQGSALSAQFGSEGAALDAEADWLGSNTGCCTSQPSTGPTIDVSPAVDNATLSGPTGANLSLNDYCYWTGCPSTWPLALHLGGHLDGSTVQADGAGGDGAGVSISGYCYECVNQNGIVADTVIKDTSIGGAPVIGNAAAEPLTGPGVSIDVESEQQDTPAVNAVQVLGDATTPITTADDGIDSYAYSDSTGAARTAMTVSGLVINSGYRGVDVSTESWDGPATGASTITNNTIKAPTNDGVRLDTYADSSGVPATSTDTVSGNTIPSPGAVGVEVNLGGAMEQVGLQVTKNTVTGAGGDGIELTADGNSVHPAVGQDFASVTGNTVTGSGAPSPAEGGGNGIDVVGLVASVTGNTVEHSLASGLKVNRAQAPGAVSCNILAANTVGATYARNTADPVTTSNSFVDPAVANSANTGPYDLTSDGTTNAQGNFWGAGVDPTKRVKGTVDTTNPLSAPPACVLPAPVFGGGGGGGGLSPDNTLGVSSTQAPVSPTNPVVVTVYDPNSGPVTFGTGSASTPNGYTSLADGDYVITAPTGTAANPLKVVYTVDSSVVPSGTPIVVTRDGVPVVNTCAGGATATQANPDPCLLSYVTLGNGDVQITILTSHASTWALTTPAKGSIAAVCAAAGADPFTDVAGDANAPSIACLASLGIAKGVTATAFQPTAHVTRGQMAAFLSRMLSHSGVSLPNVTSSAFTDVPLGSTFGTVVNQLAKLGVTKGLTATTFAPNSPVTRGQMASFLVRAYQLATGTALPAFTTPFSDIAGNTHAGDIARIANAGITIGATATTFAPGSPVARDQMAAFIARTLNLLSLQGLVH